VFLGIPRVVSLAVRAGIVFAAMLCAASPLRAQTSAPGGFMATASDNGLRAPVTNGQAQAFVPQRGVFTFPAPYGTQGIRITNASDCNGGDCVDYGYSYWSKINNHVGSDTMLIVVGLNRSRGGTGPTLFTFNKNTGETRNAGPLFDANTALGTATAEQWYFSASRASTLYLGENGPRMLRFDVLSKTMETVFDVTSLLGGGKYLWQMHSSNDDRVHSATVKDSSTYQDLGCLVYREDTRQHFFFPPKGDYDECQIDKSGRWLVIKENVDGAFNEDNRVIDIDTGVEQVLWDQNGAAGHSDMGFGYIVGEDDKWAANPYGVRVWTFGPNMNSADARVVYAMPTWNGPGAGHIAHGNGKAGLPLEQQMACSSNAGDFSLARTNEIVCYRLDGSMQALVVAPNMTDLNAAGGGSDAYSKRPKGNIDVTGEYFLWTSNMGGNRADVFVVRIPTQLLGVSASAAPPTNPVTNPTPTPAPSPSPAPPVEQPPATPVTPPSMSDAVQWMFTTNVTVAGATVTKTGGCDGCPDASAVSSGQVSGTGVVQFAASEPGTLRYIGLGYGGPGTAAGDINYALRLQNGVLEVRENNAYRTETAFTTGDALSIAVENGTVRYLRNGGVFYTSATPATSALRLHAVFFNAGGSISSVAFGGTTAPPVASATTPVAPTTGSNVFRRAIRRATGSTPKRR
jgi:hypothetical protein